MIESIIKELADRLSRQRGFRTPYEIIILPELPRDPKGRERIVIIKAGTPPTIVISRLYIEICALSGKASGLPKLRDTVERALEYLPKMYHTLALVPMHDAVALRKDSRSWKRALVPQLKTDLNDSNFEVSYSVTVKDKITETTITRNGSNIKEIEKEAKHALSKMIIESEEMDDYREMKRQEAWAKELAVNPNEVIVALDGQKLERVETTLEY